MSNNLTLEIYAKKNSYFNFEEFLKSYRVVELNKDFEISNLF